MRPNRSEEPLLSRRTSASRALLAKVASATAICVASGAGCTVGPDYVVPDSAAPAAWHAAADHGLTAAPLDRRLLSAWWVVLDDPLLDELVQRAVAANLDVREATARLREARARRRRARADLLPQVDAGAGVTHARSAEASRGSFDGADFDAGDLDRTLYDVGFDASWELDFFGGLRRELEAARADLEASEQDLGDVLVTLIGEVALAYVEVRELQTRLHIARANLAAQAETYEIAGWRAEAGLTTALDVEQARTNLEQTRAEIPTLRSSLAQAENRLAVLIGAPPGGLAETLAQRRPIPVAPLEVAIGVPAETLLRRPDVRRAERQLAAETARVGVATAAGYPSVRLVGSSGLEALDASNLFTGGAETATGALDLAQSIFDFGRIRAGIDAQDAVREQALARFEAAVLAALEEVENALVAFAQEQERRRALADAAASAERAADLSRDQYASGLVDFESVLVAERALFSLQDQLAASEGEITANLIRLYKALGGGWPQRGSA